VKSMAKEKPPAAIWAWTDFTVMKIEAKRR